MSTDVRHDCQGCSHSNDSHDAELGCLYPNCRCANKYPASQAEMVRRTLERAHARLAGRAPKRRERRFWRGTWRLLRWFLGSVAAAVLAALVLVGAAVVAVAILMTMGDR